MTTERLDIVAAVKNAHKAARDLDKIAREMEDIDDQGVSLDKTFRKVSRGGIPQAADSVGVFQKSAFFLGVRLTALGYIIGAVAVALVALSPLINWVAMAFAGLAVILLPLLALGVGMFSRFAAMSGVAGSAARGLAVAFADIKDAFVRMVAPGADIIFRALADIFQALAPVLISLRPAMTAFATAVAQGMRDMIPGLVALGPLLADTFRAAGPALADMLRALPDLIRSFIELGKKGIPKAAKMVVWLFHALEWLFDGMQKFEDSSFYKDMMDFWKAVAPMLGEVWKWIVLVVKGVWELFKALGPILGPVLKAFGTALVWVSRKLREFIEWLSSKQFEALRYAVQRVVLVLVDVAKKVWDIGVAVKDWVVGAFNTVKPIVVSIWNWLVNIVDKVINFGLMISNHVVSAFDKVMSVVNTIKDAIQWMIDNAGKILPELPNIPGVGGGGGGFLGIGGLAGDVLNGINSVSALPLPGGATGGTIARGGPLWVGERGPEIVNLPSGARITPDFATGGGDTIVHATITLPNGDVLARETLRAAKRQRASR